MMKIPLEHFSTSDRSAPTIRVDVGEDLLVDLFVDLERAEIGHRGKPNELLEDEYLDRVLLERAGRYAEALLVDEILRLRTILDNVADYAAVWRSLTPREARSLAAALRHYADESER